MTDERDPEIAAAYRDLGAEEPPRTLDDAILAAARRAAGSKPGLPGRAAPSRPYAALAAAAVLVLAVGVTLHLQVEQPGIDAPVPRPPKPVQRPAAPPQTTAQPKSAPMAGPRAPQAFVPDPTAAPAATARPPEAKVTVQKAPARIEARDAAAGESGEQGADLARPRAAREDFARARRLPASEAADKRAEAPSRETSGTPERELDRIAAMRAEGRHDEADKALAEFRRRYPDFRIPEQMRARVERR